MQIAVIGLGSFGSRLAETLYNLGGEVIAIDNREELIEDIKNRVTQAIQMDATDERALRAIGMEDMDTAVIAIGNQMQNSIMVTALLRQIGVTRIISRAISNLHEKVLYEVGASQVLRLEEQMGEQAAKWIIAPDVLKQYSFAKGHSFIEVKPKERFIGKTVVECDIREDFDLGIAAIQKRTPYVDEEGHSVFKTKIIAPPSPDDQISSEDILVLFGHDNKILNFTKSD